MGDEVRVGVGVLLSCRSDLMLSMDNSFRDRDYTGFYRFVALYKFCSCKGCTRNAFLDHPLNTSMPSLPLKGEHFTTPFN